MAVRSIGRSSVPPERQEELPPSSLRTRITPSVNWEKTFAAVMILFILIVPFAGIAAASLVPRAQCQNGGCVTNATCHASSNSIAEFALHRYLQSGEAGPAMPRDIETCIQTAKQHLAKADNLSPRERALCLHEARVILSGDPFGRRHEIKILTNEALLGEVEACQLAAQQLENPYDQLSWILRAMKELVAPLAFESRIFHQENADASASVLEQAGTILGRLPLNNKVDAYLREFHIGVKLEDFLLKPRFTQAVCFERAAGYLSFNTSSQAKSKTLDLYQKALRIFKSIESTSIEDQIVVQERICLVYDSLLKREKRFEFAEGIYQESMVLAELHEKQEYKTIKGLYHTVERSNRLRIAAEHAPLLKRQKELYEQALGLAEKAWRQDPRYCHSIDPSLLLTLRQAVKDVNGKIVHEILYPPKTILAYLWVAFRNFFSTK